MTRPSKPTIAETFGHWLELLNEAHRQGLVDDCHELARIAEGLRQLAEAVCERDPDWDCFTDGEFDQELFDMVWSDVRAWSTEGKVDELLCIESFRTEPRRTEQRKSPRDQKAKVSNATQA